MSSTWVHDASYVHITIGAAGIKATMVDNDEMIVGEQSVAAGAELVEFIRKLWHLGFVSGAVSVHEGRGETTVYFVRDDA